VGADSSGSAEGAVVVYLTGGSAQNTLPALRQETESLMQSAGYTLDWRDSAHGVDAANLVVVALNGDCTAPATPTVTAAPIDSGRSLAAATVQDGVILPFAHVDCAAVRSILGPLIAREAPARRSYLYGRAIGRLIAHELYHVMAQTREHAPSGIGKPCFTAADLVSDRFEFEAVALRKMRRAAADSSPALDTDASGR